MDYDFNNNGHIDQGFEQLAQNKFDWDNDNLVDKEEVVAELATGYVVGKVADEGKKFVTQNLENVDELGDAAGWIGSAVKVGIKYLGNLFFP